MSNESPNFLSRGFNWAKEKAAGLGNKTSPTQVDAFESHASSRVNGVLPFLALSGMIACNPGLENTKDTSTPADSGYNMEFCDDNPEFCDRDKDGTTDDQDCNKDDDSVFPGAPELCDGQDNDCDNAVDEDPVNGETFHTDADHDGFGDPSVTVNACEQPTNTTTAELATDCNDADAAVNPSATEMCDGIDNNCDTVVDEDSAADAATWYQDADADAYGNASVTAKACSAPTDFVADATDCDDARTETNPTADEYCNGIDDNCDGDVDPTDSVDAPIWYLDKDSDGSGTDETTARQCTQPADPVPGMSYVDTDGDCDDNNNTIHPGAIESCNGVDDDCDGYADDTDTVTYFKDADEDGYGTSIDTQSKMVCEERPEGYVTTDGDCNDDASAINPAATEMCDGVNNDCDTDTDEADSTDASTWYQDTDSDGFGNATASQRDCYQPADYVADSSDCDDTDAAVNPGATEYCDGADNDCNGVTDEPTAVDALTFYRDADSDTYGNPASSEEACSAPAGYVADSSDCDDGRATVNPGAAEVCDELDNDCDGTVDESSAIDADTWYQDTDSDTFGNAAVSTPSCDQPIDYVADATDCNDADATINPAASERCDGVDNDCDGTTDEASAVDADTLYRDADSDTYGNASTSTTSCSDVSGYVTNATDCDDTLSTVHPDAEETCDGVVQNCDGEVDNNATDTSEWFSDIDEDGFGDSELSTLACDEPAGYTDNADDCDDANDEVNPGEVEGATCDGFDNDCSGEEETSAGEACETAIQQVGYNYGTEGGVYVMDSEGGRVLVAYEGLDSYVGAGCDYLEGTLDNASYTWFDSTPATFDVYGLTLETDVAAYPGCENVTLAALGGYGASISALTDCYGTSLTAEALTHNPTVIGVEACRF